MFTGIIQALGTVDLHEPRGGDVRLGIGCGDLDLGAVKIGDSIAVNGVCLTAVELGAQSFVADVSQETLQCTSLGQLAQGSQVNLESALTLNTALGGMATLGWQFPATAVPVGETPDHARHDSNARYFAGAFAGLSLIVAAGAFALPALGRTIAIIMLAMALGGLFRLAQSDYSPLTDAALLPSFLFEVVGFPLIAFWIWRRVPSA